MVVCADTSFLFALYGNDANTPRAVAWMKRCRTALSLSTLNEYELANALRFAEFRKEIAAGEAALFWAQFEADRASGRIKVQVCNLADVVDEAKRLSATHTLTGGHRGFDILHVAAAIRLAAKNFLTFDRKQKELAEAEGLVVPV
ncbi:MAG: type II toxin-antitoxin system VapC family toxin [Verrucomicrobiales bacterium]